MEPVSQEEASTTTLVSLSSNPLIIPGILENVLGNLGNKDLLRCRLVCKSWSDQSLRLLSKAQQNIKLDVRNIKRHTEFLSLYSSSARFKFNVLLAGWDDEFHDMLLHIDALVKVFGPYSINTLHLVAPINLSATRWAQVYLLLEKIGPGLTELSLHQSYAVLVRDELEAREEPQSFISSNGGRDRNHSNWFRVFNTVQTSAVCLQRLRIQINVLGLPSAPFDLTRLRHLTSLSAFLDSRLASIILFELVSSAPNLKSLCLFGTRFPADQRIQQKYSYRLLNKCCRTNTSLANLQRLELVVPVDADVSTLLRLQFSNVCALRLQIVDVLSATTATALNAFLQINCPSLRRLELIFSCGFNGHQFSASFPALPELTHFGYSADSRGWKSDEPRSYDLCIGDYAGMAQKFPSLQSFSIDLGLCLFGNGKNGSRDFNADDMLRLAPGFSTVSILTLTIVMVNEFNTTSFNCSRECYEVVPTLKQNIDQLRALFPNLTTLVIRNRVLDVEDWMNKYQVLVVRQLLETIDGIEELEFLNYNEDVLSKVLVESPAAVQNLSSVRRIRIPDVNHEFPESDQDLFPEGGISARTRNERGVLALKRPIPIVCLKTFLTHLPGLEVLQVASPSTSSPWKETAMKVEELLRSRPSLQVQHL